MESRQAQEEVWEDKEGRRRGLCECGEWGGSLLNTRMQLMSCSNNVVKLHTGKKLIKPCSEEAYMLSHTNFAYSPLKSKHLCRAIMSLKLREAYCAFQVKNLVPDDHCFRQ